MNASKAEIAVAGVGMECATGDAPGALLGSLLAGLPAVRPHDALAAPDPLTGELAAPVLAPAIPDAEVGNVSTDAVVAMLAAAVERAMDDVETAVDKVVLVLPEADAAAFRRVRQKSVTEGVIAANPWLQGATIECVTCTQGGAALGNLWNGLAEGRWRCVLFAGVDSLANLPTLAQRAGRVRTTAFTDAWALGEAAACVRLERATGAEGGIRLHAPVTGHEPHYNAIARNQLKGLAEAAREALTAAGLEGGKPEAVVLARAQESLAELEWYHARSELWPQRLPPREQLAMRRGELEAPQPDPEPPVETLRPALTLGETGAAGLPVALALAHARFQLDLMPVRHCLVLDAPAGPERLAVCLSTQHTNG